jgi:FMN-dependent NADH-azoreductase
MKLLHIDSGILGENSVTRRLSAATTAEWIRRHKNLEVTYRDLAANPIGHLTGGHLAGGAGQAPDVQKDVAEGAKALDEFLSSDVVVIGAPMYNFSIPSQLKAWIDRIAVAGKTFRYTANGPVGLAGGKKVIVVSSRGGYYNNENGLAALDHQESYLRTVLGFLGVTDIEFVRAEGVAISPESKQKAIAAAERAIRNEGFAKAA